MAYPRVTFQITKKTTNASLQGTVSKAFYRDTGSYNAYVSVVSVDNAIFLEKQTASNRTAITTLSTGGFLDPTTYANLYRMLNNPSDADYVDLTRNLVIVDNLYFFAGTTFEFRADCYLFEGVAKTQDFSWSITKDTESNKTFDDGHDFGSEEAISRECMIEATALEIPSVIAEDQNYSFGDDHIFYTKANINGFKIEGEFTLSGAGLGRTISSLAKNPLTIKSKSFITTKF